MSDEQIWTPDLRAAMTAAGTFVEMRTVALEILPRHAQPLGMLCGPISSGGEGTIDLNLAIFNRAIPLLRAEGRILFNQIPFEPQMHRIIGADNGYYLGPEQLLEEFYLPIFESGFLRFLIFLPTWPTSVGATWEHSQAERLGIPKVYQSQEWYDELKA